MLATPKIHAPLGATIVTVDKRPVVVTSKLQIGDKCYIDGYVSNADDEPRAVVVRLSDGYIDLIEPSDLSANKKVKK